MPPKHSNLAIGEDTPFLGALGATLAMGPLHGPTAWSQESIWPKHAIVLEVPPTIGGPIMQPKCQNPASQAPSAMSIYMAKLALMLASAAEIGNIDPENPHVQAFFYRTGTIRVRLLLRGSIPHGCRRPSALLWLYPRLLLSIAGVGWFTLLLHRLLLLLEDVYGGGDNLLSKHCCLSMLLDKLWGGGGVYAGGPPNIMTATCACNSPICNFRAPTWLSAVVASSAYLVTLSRSVLLISPLVSMALNVLPQPS